MARNKKLHQHQRRCIQSSWISAERLENEEQPCCGWRGCCWPGTTAVTGANGLWRWQRWDFLLWGHTYTHAQCTHTALGSHGRRHGSAAAPGHLLIFCWGQGAAWWAGRRGRACPADLGDGCGGGGIPHGTAKNWGRGECAASPAHSDRMELLSPAPGRGCGARALGKANCGEVPAVNVVSTVQMREIVL